MDKLHGKGKMIDPVNKTVYGIILLFFLQSLLFTKLRSIEGDFVDDKREGNGKFIYEGGYYEGGYHNNKQNGEGKQAIGPHLLIGFFVDGVCKSGRLSYECGDIYIGEFNEDLDKHGNGKFFDADDGSIRAGLWENDVFISK